MSVVVVVTVVMVMGIAYSVFGILLLWKLFLEIVPRNSWKLHPGGFCPECYQCMMEMTC